MAEVAQSYFPIFVEEPTPPLSPPTFSSSASSLDTPPNEPLPLPVSKEGLKADIANRHSSLVTPNSPPWSVYRGIHESSFAHPTMTVRLPTILNNAIDDFIRSINEEWEGEKIGDGIKCLERMKILSKDLCGISELRPIIDDGEGDVPLWNKAIAKHFRGLNFMNAPWLFAEAYMYRRLQECFSMSRHWKDYDPFFRQKCDTFSRSSDAVFELSKRFAKPLHPASSTTDEQRSRFLELAQVCLWGNATDLSLLINMTEEQIKNLQSTGGENLKATEKNILANHLPRLWEMISSESIRGGRIDFILDNAGFELYCDCLFADYLIQSGLASKIYFHGKRIPWFVSDVTYKDFNWLLNSMVHGQLFPSVSERETESLQVLGSRWKSYLAAGTWVYEQHPFFCTGHTYWDLPTESPDLFFHLANSELLIFKGDLNHRKLTYDCAAPSTTRFDSAIGPMSTHGGAPRIVSMRTIKSDVVVGMPEDGIAERLDREEVGWRISGKYAVVLLSEGN